MTVMCLLHGFYYAKAYEYKHKNSNAVLRSGTVRFELNKALFPTAIFIFDYPFSTFKFPYAWVLIGIIYEKR